GKIRRVHHGETPGLSAGPLILGLVGVCAGLVPNFFAYYVVGPAAAALLGTPIDLSVSLWHGLTPMLALSAAVVSLGALLAWKWESFHYALNRAPLLKRVDANRLYDRTVSSMLLIARWCTQQLQNGDIRRYTLITSIALVVVGSWLVVRTGGITTLAY